MERKTSFITVCGTIKKRKSLRILSVLIALCVLLMGTFLVLGKNFEDKTISNRSEIEKDTAFLENMEKLATGVIDDKAADTVTIEEDAIKNKEFADYEEVIPFITFLESLFTIIDPKAEISIKSKEEQILKDHFADYKITLKLGEKKELFFKALDELYNSSFITKLTAFSMNYKALDENNPNKLTDVDFTVRLFLK